MNSGILCDVRTLGKQIGCLPTCPAGNTVSKGEDLGPSALALSPDNLCLAFVGPLEFTVTVLLTETLDEVYSTTTGLMCACLWNIPVF